MTCPDCATGDCIYNAKCPGCEVRMVARCPDIIADKLIAKRNDAEEFRERVARERVRLSDLEGFENEKRYPNERGA